MLKHFVVTGLILLGIGTGYSSYASQILSSRDGQPLPEQRIAANTAAPFQQQAKRQTGTGEFHYGREKIKEILETLGYDHIRFTTGRRPHYQVTACRGTAELQLDVNQWGEIEKSRKLGRCQQNNTASVGDASPTQREQRQAQPPSSRHSDMDHLSEESNSAAQQGPRFGTFLEGENSPVTIDDDGVKVNVPTTRVEVTKDRVRVRAPFVDLDIPRR